MSSLFQEINRVLSGDTTPDVSTTYIIEDYESKASFERVHLFEARKALAKEVPSKADLAKAMVQIAGTQSMTRAEQDPDNAIIASACIYRQYRHLRESWKVMGKLIEAAATNHDIPLKEMVGKYNDSQLNLLEMTLQLPWRLKYPTEPKEVEVQDYAIPNQEHIFRGTDPMMDDVPQEDEPVAMESVAGKLKAKRKSLNERVSMEQHNEAVEEAWKVIANAFHKGVGSFTVNRTDRNKNTIILTKHFAGRETADVMVTVEMH